MVLEKGFNRTKESGPPVVDLKVESVRVELGVRATRLQEEAVLQDAAEDQLVHLQRLADLATWGGNL